MNRVWGGAIAGGVYLEGPLELRDGGRQLGSSRGALNLRAPPGWGVRPGTPLRFRTRATPRIERATKTPVPVHIGPLPTDHEASERRDRGKAMTRCLGKITAGRTW